MSKKAEPTVTGVDVLRAALKARHAKVNTSGIAQEVGVASSVLDEFAAGRVALPADKLQALTVYLFQGSAVYDASVDRLRSAYAKEPLPAPAMPPAYNPDDPNLARWRWQPPAPTKGARLGGMPSTPPAPRIKPGWV